MSDLSPKAQALVSSGRAALLPSGEDRERVLGVLRARLAAPVPAIAPRGLWVAASAAVIGAGVAAALSLSPSNAPTPTLASSRLALPAVPASVPARPEAAVLASAGPATETQAAASLAPSAKRAPDRLAEEVAILSQAAKDLRAGRASEALRGLSDHQRRFPTGLLAIERRAARAEALCSLGRFSEADAELAALRRAAPSSPLRVRAEQRCAARTTRPL